MRLWPGRRSKRKSGECVQAVPPPPPRGTPLRPLTRSDCHHGQIASAPSNILYPSPLQNSLFSTLTFFNEMWQPVRLLAQECLHFQGHGVAGDIGKGEESSKPDGLAVCCLPSASEMQGRLSTRTSVQDHVKLEDGLLHLVFAKSSGQQQTRMYASKVLHRDSVTLITNACHVLDTGTALLGEPKILNPHFCYSSHTATALLAQQAAVSCVRNRSVNKVLASLQPIPQTLRFSPQLS